MLSHGAKKSHNGFLNLLVPLQVLSHLLQFILFLPTFYMASYSLGSQDNIEVYLQKLA